MISYLGVSIDELVTTFEAAFSFSDDRTDRVYEAPYHLEEIVIDESKNKFHAESAEAGEYFDDEFEDLEDDEDEDEDEDDLEYEDDFVDVFVDDDGRLHSLGESLPFAAEAIVGFLTDYIITDDLDEEWLSLSHARGALLALRISLPSIEELPELTCAYSFKIRRDLETGLPSYVTMKALSADTLLLDSLTRTAEYYEGVVSDETALDELLDSVSIPDTERFALSDAISEAVFHLADEQCGISFDVRKFRGELMKLAAKHRVHVVLADHESETKH